MSVVDSHLELDFTKSPRDSTRMKCLWNSRMKEYYLNPDPNTTVKRLSSSSTGTVDFRLASVFAAGSEYPIYSDKRNWSRGRVKPPTCQEVISWVSDYFLIAAGQFGDPYTEAESLLTQKFSAFKQVKAIHTGRYLSELVVHIHLSVENFEKSLMFALFRTESDVRQALEQIPFSFHYFPRKLTENRDVVPRSFKLIYEC